MTADERAYDSAVSETDYMERPRPSYVAPYTHPFRVGINDWAHRCLTCGKPESWHLESDYQPLGSME